MFRQTATDGGQNLRMPFQLRAVRPVVNAVAPVMGETGGNELSGNPPTDINGAYQLNFTYTKPAGTAPNPAKIRVQESADNGATWTTLADVPGNQTSYQVAGRGNGTYQYRVAGLFTVEGGLIDGPASNVKTVIVDRRIEADVTSLVQAAIVSGTVSFSNGVFQFDQTLKNVSSGTGIFSPLNFTVTSISSNSGTVRVQNADNGGDGVNTPGTFSYTSNIGSDQQLTPNEISSARRLIFSDPAAEMFTFTAVVKGHLPDTANAAGSGGAGSGGSGGSTQSGSSSGGGAGTNGGGTTLPVSGVTLRFTVNPLTNSLTVSPLQ